MDTILDQEGLSQVVDLLVRVVEATGAIVIVCGAVVAFARFVVASVTARGADAFVPIRLELGRFLALGLEFQLAGDILRTAVAPTLREIGELAAIAAIRTALNFFLRQEIKEERAEVQRRNHAERPDDPEAAQR